MRLLHLLLLLSIASVNFAQNLNVTHRSTVTFTNQVLANVWGYTAGGHEYALVGAQQGMVVVDVTNPDAPSQIVQITGPSSSWREIKTYQNYAYVVSEGGGAIQVVNLSNLPGSNLTYHSVTGGSGITKGHALHVDETKGYLYVYGSNLNGGRAQVFNLNTDPYNPSYVGFVNFIGYVHDGYVDNDLLYAAHIYAGQVAIVNMANKTNPVLLGTFNTPNNFTHNTWKSGSHLFTTDEVSNSWLAAYNVSNPANVTLVDKIQLTPGSGSIVHNTHVIDDYAVTSWYRDGFAIVDVSRPANMVITGKYDTYPNGAGNGFDGCWGVYPYFPSGTIVASNIKASGTNNGELWVMTPNYVRGCYLEGQITNAANGQPLNGANVQLLTTGTQENSNASGLYKMGLVQSGTYTARVSKAGFVTQDHSVTLNNGVLTILNVALSTTPLPVELLRFDAVLDGRDAQLTWATASEKNNAGFDVQQSDDNGETWKSTGFVPALGDGNSLTEYSFRVNGLETGTHFFRLQQRDRDGTTNFSPWRSVFLASEAVEVKLSPNPTSHDCTVKLLLPHPGKVELTLHDNQYQAVLPPLVLEIENEMDYRLPLSHLPAGVYYLRAKSDQGQVTKQVIKVD